MFWKCWPSNQALIGVVDQPEDKVGPDQHRHEAGRLHEQVADLIGLLDQDQIGLLQLLGPLVELGGALKRGLRLARRAKGHVLQPLDFGDVHRVLKDIGDLAFASQSRRPGRREVEWRRE